MNSGQKSSYDIRSSVTAPRTTAGNVTDALFVMTQKNGTQPVQIAVSVKNGMPRSGGARMRVFGSDARVQ